MNSKILIPLLSLLMFACSQARQLDEMHDTTAHMDQTTTDMNKTMNDMSGTTKAMADTTNGMAGTMNKMSGTTDTLLATMTKTETHIVETEKKMDSLSERTDGLCRGSGQALPWQARTQSLEQLTAAGRPNDILSWTVGYVEGLDFQAWPLCASTPTEVNNMFADAADEFLALATRYDRGTERPDVFVTEADTADQKEDLAFNMLALAITRVNHHQTDYQATHAGSPIYTMFGILRDGLLNSQKVQQGKMSVKDLKTYEENVILQKKEAIKILQANQAMSGAVLLQYAQDAKVNSLMNNVYALSDRYFSFFTQHSYKWQIDVDKMDLALIDRLSTLLDGALDSRAVLKQIGVAPTMDVNERALLKGFTPLTKMKFDTAGAKVRTDFIKKLQRFQNNL